MLETLGIIFALLVCAKVIDDSIDEVKDKEEAEKEQTQKMLREQQLEMRKELALLEQDLDESNKTVTNVYGEDKEVTNSSTIADELLKLHNLKESGIITQAEHNKLRKSLFDNPYNYPK